MGLLSAQQAERHDRILAAARKLIKEVGYEGVTIRDLARASRVSVPTLYKFFGDKDKLLIAAVEDQFSSVLQAIKQPPGLEGLEILLGIIEGCATELVRTSRYSKAVLAVFVRSGKTSTVMRVVGRDLNEGLTRALDEMRRAKELAPWVNAQALAERLTAHQIMVCIEWESGNLTSKQLYPTMAYGACMMLLGATRGPATRRLTNLVPKLQADIASGRAGRSKKKTRAKGSSRKSSTATSSKSARSTRLRRKGVRTGR